MADINEQILEQLRQMNRFLGGDVSSGVKPKAPTADLKDEANRVALRKQVNEYSRGLRETTSVAKGLTNVFEGAREELNFEQAGEGLKGLSKALKQTTDPVEQMAIKEARAEMVKAVAIKTAVTSVTNFASGMLKAADMMVDASRAFELAIQSGASGVQAGTDNLIASIQANKAMQDTQADAVKDVSAGLGTMLMAFGPIGIVLGGIVTVLGPLVSSFMKRQNEQEAKAAEHRAKLMGEELKKTQDSYKQTTAAGALFAGGMTELREQAANAGMRLKDFSEAVSKNVEMLAQMGMTVTEAAIRMGNVRKIIKDSELNNQFRNLGMESKEQAEVIALASVSLQNAGQLRSASDKTVATTAFAYAKDLKVLQELTGQDAKKKIEAAQKETMAADIRAKLLAEDPTGESLKRFEKVFTIVPEELKKGFLEKISTGGAAIADVSYNIAAAQNDNVAKVMNTFYEATMDKTKTASQAFDTSYEALGAAGRATLTNAQAYETFSSAARLTGDATLQGANGITTAMIQAGVNIKEGAAKAAREAAEKTSTTQDPLTKSVNRLEIETEAAAVALEKRLTLQLGAAADALPRFTGALGGATEALLKMAGFDKINAEAKEQAKKDDQARQKDLKEGKWYDFLFKQSKTSALGSEADMYGGYARGGIARGPESGFKTTLHGTEAVIPLPDGKTVPVSLEAPQFLQSMRESQVNDTMPPEMRAGFENYLQSMKMAQVQQTLPPELQAGFKEAMMRGRTDNITQVPSSAYEKVDVQSGIFGSIASKLTSFADSTVDALKSTRKAEDTELLKSMSKSMEIIAQKLTAQKDEAVMAEVRDLIKSQLSKHDEIIGLHKENVDINQRLLNHSYT